jgi:hypothetical protein
MEWRRVCPAILPELKITLKDGIPRKLCRLCDLTKGIMKRCFRAEETCLACQQLSLI